MVYIFAKEPVYSEINSSDCNRYMSSHVSLSVICRLSVTFMHHNFSAIFLRHLVRSPSVDIEVKFYGDLPRGSIK